MGRTSIEAPARMLGRHLQDASQGSSLSAYHLQAGIAACHALAPSFEETRQTEIVRFYDLLRVVDDSPIVALNRAIAVSFRDGPEQGLRIVDALTGEPRFREFALVHAARGDMLRRLGRSAPCAEAYEAARLRAGTPAERRFLEKRIAGAMSA